MITILDVKKLAKIRIKSKDNLILSVYVNTNRRFDQHEKYLALFKNMAKEIGKEASGKGAKNIITDLDKIENYLAYQFNKKAKGLVIFSCQAENIWQVLELSVGVFNQYFLAHSPYINPLIALLEDYERFCILVVDKEHARIFTVYLGKIKEHIDVFDKVTGRHKKGGSSAARFSRHREDEVRKHLKKIADLLFRFFKKNDFDHLIIGYTTPEILPLLESVLHTWLKERIVGKFDAEIFASGKKILEKSLKIEKSVELQKEEKIVELLENNLEPNRKGVTGLDDTLFELQEGKVEELIIYQGFSHRGSECQKCKYLDAWQEKVCPLCRFPMRLIKDVVEKAVKKALEQNIKIKFVRNKRMIDLGKIGANLRF